MHDSLNHTRFPEEDHLPEWVCGDKHGNKGDHVECMTFWHDSLYTYGDGRKSLHIPEHILKLFLFFHDSFYYRQIVWGHTSLLNT